MIKKTATSFQVSTSGREDGTVVAVYVTLLQGDVSRTEEVVADQLLVDYNREGAVVGIEILAPVEIDAITRYVDADKRSSFRKFLKQSVPSGFVHS